MNPVTLSKQGVRGEKNCVDFRSAASTVHYFVLCNFRNVESGLVIHGFLQPFEQLERETEVVSINIRNYNFFSYVVGP